MNGRVLLAGLTAALGVAALAAGCFAVPDAAVQFSCDPSDAPQCPEGYSCEADGCCHRDVSDVMENFGACKLGSTDTVPTGSSATDSATGTDTEASAETTGDTTSDPSDSTGAGTRD